MSLLRKNKEASLLYHKVLDVDPNDANAHLQLKLMELDLKKDESNFEKRELDTNALEEELSTQMKLLDTFPNDVSLQKCTALLLHALGRSDESARTFDIAESTMLDSLEDLYSDDNDLETGVIDTNKTALLQMLRERREKAANMHSDRLQVTRCKSKNI